MNDKYGRIEIFNKTPRRVDVYLDGIIGSSFFDEGITRKSLKREIDSAGEVDEIHLFLNSPGGIVHEGMAIYNYLARHDARVVMHVDGMAASAASVIAMAGDRILIYDGAEIMVHNAWMIALGNKDLMKKVVEELELADKLIAAIYSARTGLSERDVSKMMDRETFMGAEKAVELGFADERIPAKERPAREPQDYEASKVAVAEVYQKWAETVTARGAYDELGEERMVALATLRPLTMSINRERFLMPEKGVTHTMEKAEVERLIAAAIGPLKSTLARVNDALGIDEGADPVAAVTALRATNVEATTKLENRQKAELEKNVDGVFAQAKLDGKMWPAEEPGIRAMIGGWQKAAENGPFSISFAKGSSHTIVADGDGLPEALEAFFDAMPKKFTVGQATGAQGDPGNDQLSAIIDQSMAKDVRAEYADDPYVEIDEDSARLNAKIRQYMKANRCDYLAAFTSVTGVDIPAEPNADSLQDAIDLERIVEDK